MTASATQAPTTQHQPTPPNAAPPSPVLTQPLLFCTLAEEVSGVRFTFIGSSLEVAGQGLEGVKRDAQLLADMLGLPLPVALLHAIQDVLHIPFKPA